MSNYWQGKGAGKRIAIRFNKPLLGDVTGNANAFTVKGMVRNPLKYGPLTERTFDVESVERYPLERYWRDEFDGDMDGLEAGEYGLRLEREGFADDFNRDYIGNDWDVSTLASAIIADGKMITEGPADSWGTDPIPGAVLQKTLYIDGDFEITVDLEWIGRSQDLGKLLVILYDSNGDRAIHAGMNDSWVANNGQFDSYIDGITFSTGQGTRSASGSMSIKITRIGNMVSVYENSTLQQSGICEAIITGLGLSNNRLTTYAGKTAKWDNLEIITGYPDTASRTLSLDATELPESPRFRCETSTPLDTAITIEYACTAGDEPDSGDWAEIEDGDLLTITDDTLWLRYTLSTEDPSVTPTLLSAWLEEPEAPPDTILLTMAPDSRFNDVEGDITVSYEREKGTLTGNRPVEDFTESFAPTDLEPTPLNVQGTITAGIEVAVDFIEVDYVDLGHKNTITAGITVEVDLIPVSVIPP
jgi:hypothetical protein